MGYQARAVPCLLVSAHTLAVYLPPIYTIIEESRLEGTLKHLSEKLQCLSQETAFSFTFLLVQVYGLDKGKITLIRSSKVLLNAEIPPSIIQCWSGFNNDCSGGSSISISQLSDSLFRTKWTPQLSISVGRCIDHKSRTVDNLQKTLKQVASLEQVRELFNSSFLLESQMSSSGNSHCCIRCQKNFQPVCQSSRYHKL